MEVILLKNDGRVGEVRFFYATELHICCLNIIT